VVEASLAVPPGSSGRPLHDVDGRGIAVAMATQDGQAENVGVPGDWIEAAKPKAVAPKPAEAAPAEKPPKPAPEFRSPHEITPERRERLEKAFRPPPTIPDDL
jgi:hypothetical protein